MYCLILLPRDTFYYFFSPLLSHLFRSCQPPLCLCTPESLQIPCPSALPIQLPACHSPARIPPILPVGRNESFPVWPPGSSLRLALGRLEREWQANRLRSEGSFNALSTQGSWVERDTVLPRSPVRDRTGGGGSSEGGDGIVPIFIILSRPKVTLSTLVLGWEAFAGWGHRFTKQMPGVQGFHRRGSG